MGAADPAVVGASGGDRGGGGRRRLYTATPPLADPAEGRSVFGRRRERAVDPAWEAGDDDDSGGGDGGS